MKTLSMLTVVSLILVGLVSLPAVAGNTDRTGTAGAQELLIPVGARDLALGGSADAYTYGVEALYWNPAGLARTTGVEAMFSHMNYIADIGVEYGAIGVNAGAFGVLGFSVESLNFGNIPVTTTLIPEGTGQTYSPTFVTLGATYSRLLSDRISFGVTVNLISESITNTSATGVGFNAGVQYDGLATPGLKLGIVVKNIGSNMTYGGAGLYRSGTTTTDNRGQQTYQVIGASSDIPSQIEIALAYDKKLDEMNTVTVFGNFENNDYSSDLWKLGAQYAFNDLVFLRAGYNLAPNAPKDITGTSSQPYDYTLGAGIHYNFGVDFTFDYAFQHSSGIINSNNVFTVKLGF